MSSITAEEIRQLRETLGRTQEGMAAIVETSQVTWSRWERGESSPLPVFAKKLEKLRRIVAGRKNENNRKR